MEKMKLSCSADAERVMERPLDTDASARLGLLCILGGCASGLGVPEQHSKPWDPALSPSASPISLLGKNQGDQVQGLLPQFTTQGCF